MEGALSGRAESPVPSPCPEPRVPVPSPESPSRQEPRDLLEVLPMLRRRRGADELLEIRSRTGQVAVAREGCAEVVQRVEVAWIELHGAPPRVNCRSTIA